MRDMTHINISPNAEAARENAREASGQFGEQQHTAPEATLVTETNFERLQREAGITDPTDPDFNSDMDIIVPAITKSYRDLINAGIDPNDESAVETFVMKELGLTGGVPMDERSPAELVATMRAALIPDGATILFEETDQGGRWLNPIGLRLADGTDLDTADAEDQGVDWDELEWAASNIRGSQHPDFVETDSYGGYWELPPATT